MPVAPNALEIYRRDALVALRRYLDDVVALEKATVATLASGALELEAIVHAGHELVPFAYDDNGDLLHPEAEDIATAIDNGIAPDLEDPREQVLEQLRGLIHRLRGSIQNLDAIAIPADALATKRSRPRRR